MKKTLLSIIGAVAAMTGFAQQTPSPSWTITQNSNFPIVSAGVRFLDAIDNNVVWAIGYDGMAPNRNYCWFTRSIDGGNTFLSAPVFSSATTPGIGDTSSYVIANLDAIDANNAWVAAYDKGTQSKGGIFRTQDGGATWKEVYATQMYTNSAAFCNVVAFTNNNIGFTQGDPVGGEYEIWTTTNGGNTWSKVPGANIPNPTSGEYGLVNIYEKFGSSNFWWGTNKGRIFRSTDGGNTWNVAVLPGTPTASLSVNDIAFSSATNGVAYVYNTSTNPATFEMYNTTDGGATWTQINTIDPNVGKNDICNIPGSGLYASAGAGTGNQLISYSADNGVTWTNWGSTNIQYLNVDFVSPQTGWAGTFSDQANSSLEGIFKYNGNLLGSNAFAGFIATRTSECAPSTATISNFSTGNPAPAFSWSVFPAATISNSTAATPTVSFANAGTYTITLTATSGTSTSSVDKVVTIENCTGISNNTEVVASLNVFPNPTKNKITVEVANVDAYTLTLVDVLGKVVLSQSANSAQNVTLDLSNQAKGVYFLNVESNGAKTTKKIILE